jgi:RimJ/RimL family protein N-acetyltransferase
MSAFLRGDGVVLRPIEEADLDFLQRYRNHPAIRRKTGDVAPENRAALDETYESDLCDDDQVHLLACRAGDGRGDGNAAGEVVGNEVVDAASGADDGADLPAPVGYAGLVWTRSEAGATRLVFWLAPDEYDHDLAVATVECIARYAFEERRLHRIDAVVLADEDARQACLEAVGFQQEAVIPDDAFADGEYVDVLRYGLLERDLTE